MFNTLSLTNIKNNDNPLTLFEKSNILISN